MSSILDALNKVEEDRNAHASDSDPDLPFAPEKAAQTLITPPKKRRRSTRQSTRIGWKPLVYAVLGLIGIALIVGLSAAVALLVGAVNHGAPAVAAAVKSADGEPLRAVGKETYTVPVPEPKEAPAPPKPSEATAEKPNETRPLPVEPKPKPDLTVKPEAKAVLPEPKPKTQEKPVLQAVPQTVTAPPVEVKIPEPEPVKTVVENPKPSALEPVKPMTEKPALKPIAEPFKVAKAAPPSPEEPTNPLPTAEALERARKAGIDAKPPATVPMRTSPMSLAPGRAAEKQAPMLEDISKLPRLGQTERERLGLTELRLNVLREASASQPEGLAIINLKKVFVGEMIPGTNARLIAVQTRAIAVEIEGTGERFRVTN